MHKSLARILSSLAGLLLLLPCVASAQDNSATPPSKPAQSTPSTAAKSPAAKKPATAAKPSTAVALTTPKQKGSYALGMNVGTGMRKQGVADAVDPALVARGLRDALSGSKTALTEDEMKIALRRLANDVRTAEEAKAHEQAAPYRKAGEAFLAENKSKDGVKVLPDGLQYKVLTEGTGPKPAATDTVMVNYRGALISGKEFDASEKHGGAQPLQVNHVIAGWTEALQMMPTGSKWQLFIPADLAYGDAPPPGSEIPPGSTLVFDVELVSIGEPKK